jgi:hypothetical protein
LRSSLIARFAGAEFLPHAATTTADNPTANIEDLRTVRTVCLQSDSVRSRVPVGVVARRASRASIRHLSHQRPTRPIGR